VVGGTRVPPPDSSWVAGDTNETTRDILQLELVGEVGWDGNRKIATGAGGMIAPEFSGSRHGSAASRT
jgi:hypothetical protein